MIDTRYPGKFGISLLESSYICKRLTWYSPHSPDVGKIPKDTKKIIFRKLNEKLKKGSIPESVKIIIFREEYPFELEEGAIPKKLKELMLYAP